MRKFILGLGIVLALFALSLLAAVTTVNLGSRGKQVVVPDLKGAEIVAAIESLEQLGLNLKINGKEYSDDMPLGVIISHHPGPGTVVRRGRSLEAIISYGPKRIVVPDVQGAFVLQAQSIVLENNLKVGAVAKVTSRHAPRDSILSQWPPPRAFLGKNETVDLLISAGPPASRYVMPDFIGRPLAEVVRLVQEAGLEISQVGYQDYPAMSAGTVLAQKPLLGTPVGQGTRLELTVARGRSTAPKGKVRYSLLSFYIPEGLRPRKVKVVVETEKTSYEALNETRPAGDRVQVLVEVEGRTKALIYIDDRLQDTRIF